MDNPWRLVCLALLQHFDENEGTTYLYSREEREGFVEQFPQLKNEVMDMLNEYHGARP
jgi:hypothetical protein